MNNNNNNNNHDDNYDDNDDNNDDEFILDFGDKMHYLLSYLDFKNLCVYLISNIDKLPSYTVYNELESVKNENLFWSVLTQTEINKICDYMYKVYSIEINKTTRGIKDFINTMYNDVI
jgi:hypothetical protein